MQQLAYIKKNYPVATMIQLKEPQIIACDDIYIEEDELKKKVEFTHLLERLKPGDRLVIFSLKVLFIMNEPDKLLKALVAKRVRLIALEEEIDTAKDTKFFQYLLVLIDVRGECHSDYIKGILDRKKEAGITLGRPRISIELINEIQYLRQYKKRTYREIAKECGVSLGTVNKYASDEVLERVFAE